MKTYFSCSRCGKIHDEPKKHAWCSKCVQARRIEINTALLDDFFSKGCRLCGELERVVLQAHHVNGQTHDENKGISRQVRHAGRNQLKAELGQCAPLCANCHLKVHAGIVALATSPDVDEIDVLKRMWYN